MLALCQSASTRFACYRTCRHAAHSRDRSLAHSLAHSREFWGAQQAQLLTDEKVIADGCAQRSSVVGMRINCTCRHAAHSRDRSLAHSLAHSREFLGAQRAYSCLQTRKQCRWLRATRSSVVGMRINCTSVRHAAHSRDRSLAHSLAHSREVWGAQQAQLLPDEIVIADGCAQHDRAW